MAILLADDQPEVCSALRLFLEQDTEIAVADEVADAQSALAAVEALQPDVVLLDWELPGKPAPSVIREVRARSRGVRIIALSGLPEAGQQALSAGADAFVSKHDPPDCLRGALLALVADHFDGQVSPW